MPKFRKKPIVIEAEQYRGEGYLPKGVCVEEWCIRPVRPHLHTTHDNQVVILEGGDWIIPEPDGKHFYPCKPDIFEATYEIVQE